jgi:hypothetical protein
MDVQIRQDHAGASTNVEVEFDFLFLGIHVGSHIFIITKAETSIRNNGKSLD